jgi:hypothetical protein
MIQTARFSLMDASLAAKRPEFAEDSAGSGGRQSLPSRVPAGVQACTADVRVPQPLTLNTAEGRARKRFQRTTTENEDPLRRTAGFSIPFGRQNNQTTQADQKLPQHARRRSTLRDTKAPLLGPRPLENKRYAHRLYRLVAIAPPTPFPFITFFLFIIFIFITFFVHRN